MNKNNFKIKITSAAIGLFLMSSSAHATVPTISFAELGQAVVSATKGIITAAQGTITAAQTTLSAGYNYLSMRATAANGQKLSGIEEAVNNQTRQGVMNNVDADYRKRLADGQLELAKIGVDMLPSVDACVQASNLAPNSAKSATQKSAGKGGGGGRTDPTNRLQSVVSNATAQAETIKQQKDLNTCVPEFGEVAGCDPKNKKEKYAGGDMHPRGIKGNIADVPRNESAKSAYKNLTYEDDKAFDVAKNYANNMAYYDKPKVATPEQLKKNPSYVALYRAMQTKLDAAHDSVMDIIKLRRKPDSDIDTSIGTGKIWEKALSGKTYETVTGLTTAPGKRPSMFELTNFEVKYDYMGGDTKVDLSSTEEVNKRLALSNYIAWASYQQQETTNLLLSHILVQLTTPINKGQLDSEFAKTMNAK